MGQALGLAAHIHTHTHTLSLSPSLIHSLAHTRTHTAQSAVDNSVQTHGRGTWSGHRLLSGYGTSSVRSRQIRQEAGVWYLYIRISVYNIGMTPLVLAPAKRQKPEPGTCIYTYVCKHIQIYIYMCTCTDMCIYIAPAKYSKKPKPGICIYIYILMYI